MPAIDLDRIKEHGKRFADGFTPGQKAMTILGVITVVLGGMFFMHWASAPSYAPLFTGLSSQDAGSVTQELQATGVKYKIAGGGATILVPQQLVDQTRIALSTKGIPAGGDSFTLLDKQGITTDEFTRNVAYQRALQGELSRTIESIDTVESASVTLTIPQQTVFVGATQDKPTAAVLVKSSSDLSNDTVMAISHLVASSIPNMNVDDVTVADANGKVLHAPGMDTTLAGSSQIEQKQAYEDAVAKKVDDMIAATLGPGHAAVTVSADLDTSKSSSVQTTYQQPTNPGANGAPPTPVTVPLEMNNSNETLNQPSAASTNGVLGVGATGAGGATTNGATNYQKTQTQQKNGVDTTQITADTPPGTVKRMSVSAVLDSAVVTSPADVTKWTNQIQAAAGIVPARDGTGALQVTTVAFDKQAQKAAQQQLSAAAGGGGNAMFDLIKQFLTLLMIGLVLFFAWRAIKRAEGNRVPLRVPIDLRELEMPASAALEAGGGQTPAMAGARRPIEAPTTVEGEITDLIERQPDEVAQTLRSWLADRRS